MMMDTERKRCRNRAEEEDTDQTTTTTATSSFCPLLYRLQGTCLDIRRRGRGEERIQRILITASRTVLLHWSGEREMRWAEM